MGFGENEIMGSGRKIVGLVLVFKEIESKFTFFSVIILFDEKEMGGSGFDSSDSQFLKLIDLSRIFISGSSDLKVGVFTMIFSMGFENRVLRTRKNGVLGFDSTLKTEWKETVPWMENQCKFQIL